MIRNKTIKSMTQTLALLTTLPAFATAVRTLPTPDAGGYYEFGAAYTYSGTSSYQFDGNTPAYPLWSELNVPSGAKLRLTGGVIIDSWPSGVTEVDCSGLTFMAITATKAIPAGVKITIPKGAKLCVCQGTLTVGADDAVTWTAPSGCNNAMELPFDLTLNGTLYWQKNTLTLSGSFDGTESTAQIALSTQANTHIALKSSSDFAGSISSGNGSQNLILTGDEMKINHVYLNGKANLTSYFVGNPVAGASLDLTSFRSGLAGSSTASARTGTIFALSHGNVAEIGTLGGGGVHFITQTKANDAQDDTVGDATVHVGNVDPCPVDLGWASSIKAMNCYCSKNMSYVFDDIGKGVASASGRTVSFKYDLESGINTNSFVVGALPSGSSIRYFTAKLSGPTPATLPRTVTLPPNTGLAAGVDVTLTESAWAFDFDWTKDDPNLSRCAITGAKNLTIPETGTIAITMTGAPTARGKYPLFSCDTGCSALTNAVAWPVTIDGVTAEKLVTGNVTYEVVRSTTGISLSAKPSHGFRLIIR